MATILSAIFATRHWNNTD